MKKRKVIASVFILIALILGAIFYSEIVLPESLEGYFKPAYINQFGPLAICIELLIAGFYLFAGHPKTNFTMALFGFTVVLDFILNLVGLITTGLPFYALIIFLCCAVFAFWLAFSNAFGTGRISFVGAFGSFVMGIIVELFFNYL
ncbi:hypothetical protein [Eudoraea sp.]|uniref:hypothetical protein n=1 Tax=Eudoraea sp. TaxID=1979955 RepID=UPI003C70F67F